MRAEAGRSFFELFGLPARYTLDVSDLAGRYRNLQLRFHPDRYASRSDQERRLALQMTAEINAAYRTLRDPVTRGHYLLELRGIDTDRHGNTAVDPAFLAEQMELREELAEARQGAGAHQRLQQLSERVQKDIEARTAQLGQCLDGDGAPNHAPALVRELQFLEKVRREISELVPPG